MQYTRGAALWLVFALFVALPQSAPAGQFALDGIQVTKDTPTLTVQADCAPGASCSLGAITFGITQKWGNTHYACFGTQPPGSLLIAGANFEFRPQSTTSVDVFFTNPTTSTITQGTQLELAFACIGCANGASCGDPAKR